jgi:alpha-L-fucosidase 2
MPDFWYGLAARVLVRAGSIDPAGYRDGALGSLEAVTDNAAWVLVAVATEQEAEDPLSLCRQQLDAAEGALTCLLSEHVREHQRLYRRASLSLGRPLPDMTTDRLVEMVRAAGDIPPRYFSLLYSYARYLLICCSRPGSWPANEQGVWALEVCGPEETQMHVDINIEENYWLAEIANLSECHLPLLDFVEELLPKMRHAARQIYGCRGVYIAISTDGQSVVIPGLWGMWTGAAGWLAQHFWQHWEYTQDDAFLRDRAYPFLKEVAAFYLDFLVEDEDGYLITCPSVSPEQIMAERRTQYFGRPTGWALMCTNATMDIAIITEVFANLIAASQELRVDAVLRERWQEVLDRLAPWPVDGSGALREFPPGQEAGPHDLWPAQGQIIGHLYGLFPGESISVDETPELIDPARKALIRSGILRRLAEMQNWRVCCLARLLDGETALLSLSDVARRHFTRGLCGLNAWTGNPEEASVFLVDANLGMGAAIAEMLLQSHLGVIRILPALPEAWSTGKLAGWRARGGFTLDIAWDRGVVEELVLHAECDSPCRIRFDRPHKPLRLLGSGGSVPYEVLADGSIEFNTSGGMTYEVI